MNLTIAQLRKIATGPTDDSNMASIVAGLGAYGVRAGLDKPWRLAMYVAEIAEESGDFRYDHEIWGPTPAQARYDTRTDLGNTPAIDGDGKLYAGRTGIEVTGKANYAAFRDWCRAQGFNCPDFVATPDAIDTDPWEGLAPIWFWVSHGLNALADVGNFTGITQRINGGQNGAATRLNFYIRAALVFLGYSPTDIRGFQKASGLAVDGDAGGKTVAGLHQALLVLGAAPLPAAKTAVVAYVQPAPVIATNAVVKKGLLDAGSRTMSAADMQTKLLAVGGTAVGGVTMLNEFSSAAAGVPPIVWGLLLILLGLAIYLYTHRIVLARIETALTGLNTEIPIVRPQEGDLPAQPWPSVAAEPMPPQTPAEAPLPDSVVVSIAASPTRPTGEEIAAAIEASRPADAQAIPAGAA